MFFGGEELTETELQQAKKEALLDVVSQYYALKEEDYMVVLRQQLLVKMNLDDRFAQEILL